jgi:hypothetical protein
VLERKESARKRRIHERSSRNRDKCDQPEQLRGRRQRGRSSGDIDLRNVEGAWVKDMNVLIDNGSIVGYKVNLAVTFVLEDAGNIS